MLVGLFQALLITRFCCVQEGAGRRVGETTEALWSMLKPFTKVARYMKLHNWWDAYNLVLLLISQTRQQCLPDLLLDRWNKLGAKKGEHLFVWCLAAPTHLLLGASAKQRLQTSPAMNHAFATPCCSRV